jgi:cytochrome c
LRRAVIAGAIAIAASTLLARVHPFGDAGLFAARSSQAPLLENSSVPPEVRATLTAKCADCHSNGTRAPAYARLAPVSWMMERDITQGRRAMNLSLWNSYSADLQQTLAAKMVQETNSHEMPLPQYRMIHWNTRITDADAVALAQWARGLQGASAGSVAHLPGMAIPCEARKSSKGDAPDAMR